jgi:hypothetical protein
MPSPDFISPWELQSPEEPKNIGAAITEQHNLTYCANT